MDKTPDPTKTSGDRRKASTHPALLLIWVAVVPMLALMIPGLVQIRERVALHNEGIKTQALITEILRIGGLAGNVKVGVDYSYRTEDGKEMSGTQMLPSYVASPLKQNETVDVYYQREDPSVVLIDAVFVYERDTLHSLGLDISLLTVLLITGNVFLRRRCKAGTESS
jgi:hypothetical protein